MLQGISGWIAVSRRLQESMQRIFPGAPVLTLHNGADAIPQEIRSVLRPPNLAGLDVVLCVSFFYERKNIPLLIEAFDAIGGQHPEAMLIIIGDGDDRQCVLNALARAKHRNQIVLLGTLSHKEVLQYMVWCDVFALVGRNEPFGVVFTEAMMAGKPVIYATDAGIGDLAVSGIHGMGVVPDDKASASQALHQLLDNRASRVQMGQAAGALAQSQLSWATNAKQLVDIFRRKASPFVDVMPT
jgi:glycosyltransferase involved in cell wall biosynthesis